MPRGTAPPAEAPHAPGTTSTGAATLTPGRRTSTVSPTRLPAGVSSLLQPATPLPTTAAVASASAAAQRRMPKHPNIF